MEITSKDTLITILKSQIATRDAQALKALVTVFENQTSSEQASESVHVHNGVGFTPTDAEFMSSLAKQYLKKGYLSNKQLVYVKKVMPKYARQLIEQSIRSGKIIKEGSNYTWTKTVASDTDRKWTEEDNRRWVEYKNEFARLEAEQEAEAFMSKIEYEMSLNA